MATEKTPNNKWIDPIKWNTAAAQYDNAVGRSSGIAAARLITLANEMHPLNAPSVRAIDLGAGTGSLTHLLAAQYPGLNILATDISPGMLEQLMSITHDQTKVTAQVVDMAAPIGGAATESSFSHVFSTMAIQALPDPAGEGTLAQWARLLLPDGIVAIGLWDFDENCGPHALWEEAATAVDPGYTNPPLLPPRHWYGRAELEQGLKTAGFRDVKSEVMHIGFDVGKEGFLRFFWESGNPMARDRQASFNGDLKKVREEMERLLDEKYDKGAKIPLSAALAVGRKPLAG
ncbi:S-adenosyl-L-methionine-dependent methyltransferase [Mollisia scopiformis]|uniref:S-adenosyl-L-methionine-dependent methyltransferase n=1 Tax=Mollisia scopiformis TaxID=149040 RepID=A0A194XH27_MOLSC|nr:S-adenosyl-L-methionine-dependent methyltransferase [Mollisia scopiformis]KUJ19468.1 S-adenosyl-L-methionine-dependent methyltransferase [Mollisia scopiformis]